MLNRLLIIVLLAAPPVVAQEKSRNLIPLHHTLGMVTTAEHNARHNLFGEIPDLHAIKFYQEKNGNYQLRILAGSRLIIKRFSEDEGRRILQLVRRRMERPEATTPDKPAYPLSLGKELQNRFVRIVLDDDTVLNGELQSATADTINLRTPGGVFIAIPESTIRDSQRSHVRSGDGKFFRNDPNATRLFFAPTGRGLRQGQGYFADYWIFFPTVGIGITDFIGVSGGMSILPGAQSQLLYIAPKIAVSPGENFSIAGGFLRIGVPESADVTLAYGVATIGNSPAALTAGFGVPVTDERDELIYLIGGELQTSNSTKIIVENWIPSSGPAVFSFGLRSFGERIAIDLAFITAKPLIEDASGWPFVPWVDFAINFGH